MVEDIGAQRVVSEGMSEGVRDTLYELGKNPPPFNPVNEALRAYRGTTRRGFQEYEMGVDF